MMLLVSHQGCGLIKSSSLGVIGSGAPRLTSSLRRSKLVSLLDGSQNFFKIETWSDPSYCLTGFRWGLIIISHSVFYPRVLSLLSLLLVLWESNTSKWFLEVTMLLSSSMKQKSCHLPPVWSQRTTSVRAVKSFSTGCWGPSLAGSTSQKPCSPVLVGVQGWSLMFVLFPLVFHKYLFNMTSCWQSKGIQRRIYGTNARNAKRGSIIDVISCLYISQGHQLKETVLPSLTLLTESSRIHRETRKFLRSKVCVASKGSNNPEFR